MFVKLAREHPVLKQRTKIVKKTISELVKKENIIHNPTIVQ